MEISYNFFKIGAITSVIDSNENDGRLGIEFALLKAQSARKEVLMIVKYGLYRWFY